MKILTSILILCILVFQVCAQKTIEQGKQWNIINYKGFTPNFCTDLYSFRNDTIINGVEYLELFTKSDTVQSAVWISDNVFMRENNQNQIFLLDDEEEIMMYDFNLIEGDSFFVDYDGSECDLIVYQIDSIAMLNGELRKRIRLVRSDEPDPDQPWAGYIVWIQGMGSTTSLTQYAGSCFVDSFYDLLCFYENEEILYTSPYTQGCFLTPVKDIENTISLRMYPNPVHDILHLETTSKVEQVNIYTLDGQLLLSSHETSVSLGAIAPGLYLVRIETADGIALKKLFVE